jgi:hypothetical protein
MDTEEDNFEPPNWRSVKCCFCCVHWIENKCNLYTSPHICLNDICDDFLESI